MQFNQLKKILEAALLASAHPRPLPQLGALFTEDDAVGHDQMAAALESLADDCAERGIELVEVASGFRYQVRQDIHPWVARMWTERPSRYSRALLETLALIAYRQPITRGEIEQIRGVAVSSNIIRTLEEREWVRVVGHRDVVGKPALFGTTRGFLDYFNLKSLDELPPLAEILDLEDLNPQFPFDDGDGVPARVSAPDSEGTDNEDAADAAATPVVAAESADDDADDAASDGHPPADDSVPGTEADIETIPDATVTDITGDSVVGEDVDTDTITGSDIPAGESLAGTDATGAGTQTPADADEAPDEQDPEENRA